MAFAFFAGPHRNRSAGIGIYPSRKTIMLLLPQAGEGVLSLIRFNSLSQMSTVQLKRHLGRIEMRAAEHAARKNFDSAFVVIRSFKVLTLVNWF